MSSSTTATAPLTQPRHHKHHHELTIEEFSDDDVSSTTSTVRPGLAGKAPVITPPIHPIKSYKDKQNLNYIIKSGIAGGLAGSAAKTLIAPLDRVKILFQTANPEFRKYTGSWTGFYKAGKHIVLSEGSLGLFRGHSATLLRIFPYAGIKFIAYEQIRSVLIPSSDYETSVRRLLAGSLSGVASVFCTYPLDLIRVRLAYDHKGAVSVARAAKEATLSAVSSSPRPPGRLTSIIKKIYNEPTHTSLKIANFYRGFTPTVLGMIPYAGVSFWAHDSFHDIFRSKLLRSISVDYTMPETEHINSTTSRRPLKVWAQLAAGGLSGLCAQTASYPLEVVRRRMQVSGAVGNHEKQRMLTTAAMVVRERGIKGLFVGLSIGYMKVVPMFACSFFVYERAKLLIGI